MLMLLGMVLLSLNDPMGKCLVATYSVGPVLPVRSTVTLGPVLWREGLPRLLAVERPRLQAARVAFATGEVLCFHWAVTHMLLADVVTFWMAAPVIVAAASPLPLGERVGVWQWATVAAGFAGVLLALEPFGEGPTHGAAVAVALLGTGCLAAMMLTGRQPRGTPDTTLAFWQRCAALGIAIALAPLGWTAPTRPDWALLSVLGIIAMLAHLCVNRAPRLAPPAVATPLQYTLLLWAIILGWLFFGDVPRPAMLLGAAVIVATGLAVIACERSAARE